NRSDSCTTVDATGFSINPAPFPESDRNLGAKPDRVETSTGTGPTFTLSGGYARPGFALECPGWDGAECVPGADNQGGVFVIPDSISHLEAKKGLATFGRYRGHDQIIFWREVYE
ncbi:MAG TPA: DUF6701 domain-containing protein, partial [Gammaproteobacteria bacterium]|nr:DUF6701 domain-containing protein [Gammaproteobacteria bacterium]